jgi:hypothetical protein
MGEWLVPWSGYYSGYYYRGSISARPHATIRAAMFAHLKQQWQVLINGKPGTRFQEYYLRRHHAGRGRFRKMLVMTVGMVSVASGIFFLAAPGPGLVLLLAGASMLAEESYYAARAFDRIELWLLRIRHLAGLMVRTWERWPALKRLIIVLAALIVGAVGWVASGLILEP